MEAPKLSEEEMQLIYNWVDEIPLSRPKRNIARDFSDAGMLLPILTLSNSPSGRDHKALPAPSGGAPQLLCGPLSESEDLQLEHPESEALQEDWLHTCQERHRRCRQLRTRYDRKDTSCPPGAYRLISAEEASQNAGADGRRGRGAAGGRAYLRSESKQGELLGIRTEPIENDAGT